MLSALSPAAENSPGLAPSAPPADAFVVVDGVEMFRIGAVDELPPFLLSVVSDSDHWLYVSSRGGLTAGRVEAAQALFPYVTDDLLHQAHAHSGPYTLLRVQGPGGSVLWEPFRGAEGSGEVLRNLYKSVAGNQLVFEEHHLRLGLTFRSRWATSERFGFVRTVTLVNRSGAAATISLIDGLRDLMPASVPLALQQGASCLVNAYTRAEVDPETQLGLVALQALIVDQAVPAESLTTTTLWSAGLPLPSVLLSTDQVPAFRRGVRPHAEALLKGRRAAYLLSAELQLGPAESRSWDLVADVERSHSQVQELRRALLSGRDLRAEVAIELRRGTESLVANIASADGLQHTAERITTAHHFANVLFNNMRGGVFAQGHEVPWSDFTAFLETRSRAAHARHEAQLSARSGTIAVGELLAWARGTSDPDLTRLVLEYLPLTFSRRHGDPSRPWNAFNIRVKNEDGTRALDYQGNWRDIFQNWEALCRSFPEFLESTIARFVDATTFDGFNAYRLSRDGIEWESPDPHDAWSNIGYWGDHQIVYLLNLLEASAAAHPGRLEALLSERIFCFADVPYRLKRYAELVRDPRHTIEFDHERERRIEERVVREGADGKLLHGAGGELLRATLAEKLLIPVLAKLANFVLEGGIWMNTQRPEWNDANNALVGNGVSVVTLCQLRRHLAFLAALFERAPQREVPISREVAAWLGSTRALFEGARGILGGAPVLDTERRRLLDGLGAAFETYRHAVQIQGFSPGAMLDLREAAAFCNLALAFADQSIRANRRGDGLYHSYNLLEFAEAKGAQGSLRLDRLYEMLEGQVAVLSSGLLAPADALSLLDALFESRLFRADQQSFMLYPDRRLPGFLEKNCVPAGVAEANPLLAALLAGGDRSVIVADVFGQLHFASGLRTTADVRAALARLGNSPRFSALAEAHAGPTLELYAQVFDLKSFTGRSGTMFGYEGLGCIYWHMVGKLLRAVQEMHERALHEGAAATLTRRLADAYFRVRAGLGFNKSARAWGAFPADPYSHTPLHAGAQQPGMTGQVKEEILTRLGELGVRVEGGALGFAPRLLRRSEFFTAASEWKLRGLQGEARTLALSAGELGFTVCQVPVIYRLAAAPSIRARLRGGETRALAGSRLDDATSRAVLARSGVVESILVEVVAAELYEARE